MWSGNTHGKAQHIVQGPLQMELPRSNWNWGESKLETQSAVWCPSRWPRVPKRTHHAPQLTDSRHQTWLYAFPRLQLWVVHLSNVLFQFSIIWGGSSTKQQDSTHLSKDIYQQMVSQQPKDEDRSGQMHRQNLGESLALWRGAQTRILSLEDALDLV